MNRLISKLRSRSHPKPSGPEEPALSFYPEPPPSYAPEKPQVSGRLFNANVTLELIIKSNQQIMKDNLVSHLGCYSSKFSGILRDKNLVMILTCMCVDKAERSEGGYKSQIKDTIRIVLDPEEETWSPRPTGQSSRQTLTTGRGIDLSWTERYSWEVTDFVGMKPNEILTPMFPAICLYVEILVEKRDQEVHFRRG